MKKKDFERIVKRIGVSSGDLLVIKTGSLLANSEDLDRLAEVLKMAGKHDIVLITAENLDDIQRLSAREMARLGYFKVPTRLGKIEIPDDALDNQEE